MSTWADAVRLAVGTLTVWPVAPPRTVDRRAGGRAMLLAPVVALALGLPAALLGVGVVAVGAGSTVAAVLVVAAQALMTRGLHLDGLADTVDGLAASYDRARALEVMRRGDVGPLGAAALVLVLLLQTAALQRVLSVSATAVVCVAVAACVSRLSLVVACLRGVPSARPDGLGTTVSGTVSPVAGALAVGLVALLAVVAGLVTGVPAGWLVAAVVAGVGVTGALVRRCTTRLGGITGDVLGAAVELSFAAALVVLAAAG